MVYSQIRCISIFSEVELPFDLYIYLAEKYIHYIRKGSVIENNRLTRLVGDGLVYFYIKRDEEENYHQFLASIISKTSFDKTKAQKGLMGDIGAKSTSYLIEDASSEKSYQSTLKASLIMDKLLKGNDQLLRSLMDNNQLENSNLIERMQLHLSNTVSLCLKFSDFLQESIDIESLAMAAFYHDIAFTVFPKDKIHLFFTEIDQMSVDDLKLYKSHPKLAAEILQDKDYASKKVLELIISHEEKVSGEGFPNKLTNLSLEQEILSLCAFYDREITCLNKDRKLVQEDLLLNQVGNYNLSLLKKYQAFLKEYL